MAGTHVKRNRLLAWFGKPVFNCGFWLSGFQIVSILFLFAGVPEFAHAHLMNTGFGPFYDGLAHLFLTPDDLLHVIALALLAGLCGPRFGRAVLFVLPPAWVAGSIGGSLMTVHVTVPMAVTAMITIVLGALVAANIPLPAAAVTGIAVVTGLFDGVRNGIDLSNVESGIMVSAGIACALYITVSVFAGQVTTVRAVWARIAVRVAGSWIAAIGLFMLGWAARGV